MAFRRLELPERYIPWLIFAAALLLRLLLLGGKSLWGDEFYAAGLMDRGLADLVRGSFQGSPHPPLAFFALKLSTVLFGTSEAGLKAVSAILTALATVPLYLFIRSKAGTRPAVCAAALWAISPYSVSLGQEAWLYGTLAAIGFTFVWLADMAWAGSRPASLIMVPVGLAGMLVQHLFLLFLLAGFTLYFTRKRGDRIGLKRFLIIGAVLAVVYLPFIFPAMEQASLRSERLRASGILSTVAPRLLKRVPTVIARLIPGGLAGELSRWDLSDPVTPGIFIISFLLVTLPLLFLIGKDSRSMRIWGAAVFLAPFLLFITEDPTARHLSILWLPLSLGIGFMVRKYSAAFWIFVIPAALLLLPYYRLDTFPYHRSNWRDAVASVQERRSPDQMVVVIAGQNGGLAWDYYSTGDLGRLAPGGEDPYSVQLTRSELDPCAPVDSILATGTEVWVIHDIWGGPSGGEIAPGYPVQSHERYGPHLEVILFGTER